MLLKPTVFVSFFSLFSFVFLVIFCWNIYIEHRGLWECECELHTHVSHTILSDSVLWVFHKTEGFSICISILSCVIICSTIFFLFFTLLLWFVINFFLGCVFEGAFVCVFFWERGKNFYNIFTVKQKINKTETTKFSFSTRL